MSNSFIGQSGLPLGLRNNNPGDFRTGIAWQGATGSEGGFITFADISWGVRALCLDLINVISKDGLNTIRQVITKYAPPSENDTAAYIQAVSDDMGIGPDNPLDTGQQTISSLARAIMNQELGDGFSAMVMDSDIAQGYSMATNMLSTLPAAAAIAVQNNADGSITLLVAGIAIMLILLHGPGKK
jgi:hypothetical protein